MVVQTKFICKDVLKRRGRKEINIKRRGKIIEGRLSTEKEKERS